MSTSGIGIAATTTTMATSNISIQDFLKILTTELNYQDPLQPMDNKDFLAQLAQFTSLEQTSQLNDKIGNLLSLQSVSQSIGILGKTVDVQADTEVVTGQVSALDFQSGQPLLTVTSTSGGQVSNIRLNQVTAVR